MGRRCDAEVIITVNFDYDFITVRLLSILEDYETVDKEAAHLVKVERSRTTTIMRIQIGLTGWLGGWAEAGRAAQPVIVRKWFLFSSFVASAALQLCPFILLLLLLLLRWSTSLRWADDDIISIILACFKSNRCPDNPLDPVVSSSRLNRLAHLLLLLCQHFVHFFSHLSHPLLPPPASPSAAAGLLYVCI